MGMTVREINALIKEHESFIERRARHWCNAQLTFDELVQEGRLGFWQACQKWSADKGASLVTYARFWVDAHMRNAIIDAAGIARNGKRIQRRPPQDKALSFDEPYASDGRALNEIIPSDAQNPEQILLQRERERETRNVANKLSGRARAVVQGRFADEKTLEELGKELGITRERVRQLEVEALQDMQRALSHV